MTMISVFKHTKKSSNLNNKFIEKLLTNLDTTKIFMEYRVTIYININLQIMTLVVYWKVWQKNFKLVSDFFQDQGGQVISKREEIRDIC